MSAARFSYEYLVMGVVLALASLYYLSAYNATGVAIGLALIVIAAILIGVALRRPPRPAVVSVPAP
jgi:glucose uptake protein GlcU